MYYVIICVYVIFWAGPLEQSVCGPSVVKTDVKSKVVAKK